MNSQTLFPILALGGEVERGTVSGHVGRFETIPIAKLLVDSVYQRAVTAGSVKNIRRICKDFDWAKFLPVIVTQDGDTYSIVDGQHRTTAAATIGLTEVPCYILSCTASEDAAAFAAINGNVTPVQPIDLWFAELAAQKPQAVALQRVLDASGVKVTRKKEGFVSGETRSITVLQRAFEFYGSAILTTILQCIVETSDGNPGMLFGAMINGIGRAIRTKPEVLANPSHLFAVFDDIDLSELLYQAKIESARSGNPVQFIITRQVNSALKRGVTEVANAA